MNITMRNSNSDPPHRMLEKKLNHHIKSLVKLPSQSFSKESIFHKLIDLGENKKEGTYATYTAPNRNIIVEHTRFVNKITTSDENDEIKLTRSNDKNGLVDLECPKSLKDYEASFLYSENIKSSINAQSVNFNNTKNKFRKGNSLSSASTETIPKMVIEKSKDISMMECNNADSRVTGGGTTQKMSEDCVSTKPKLKISERHSQNAPLIKKNSKELNPSRKVSFKVKNPTSVHRKTILTCNKVAALTQKFNELIKENDSLIKESKVAIIHDGVPNHKIRNSDISTSTFTLPSNVNVKIKTYNKISIKRRTSVRSKSSSNASLDKVHASESPILHRKLTRVKSDCLPKKKNLLKKKSQEGNKKVELSHSIKSNNILNEINDKNDTEISELTEARKPKHNIKRKPSFKTSPTRHSVNVRAAIQKFETTKPALSTADDKIIPSENIKIVESAGKISVNKLDVIKDALQKPKVPEKKINLLKTKNLVMRDGKAKIKNIKCSSNEIQTIPNDKEDFTSSPQMDFISSPQEKVIPSPQEKVIPTTQKEEITKHTPLSTNENLKIKKGFIYEKVKFPQTYLNQCKLQLSNSTDIYLDSSLSTLILENNSIPIIVTDAKNFVNVEDKTKCAINGDVKRESLTDDEKLYQEVSARIKPNDSFLWRSNSKIDLLPLKEYEVKIDFCSENENIYDFVGPSTTSSECVKESESIITPEEIICPSFETLLKKADDLLDNKKREIAEDLKKEKNNITAQDFCDEVFNLNAKCDEEIVEAVNVVAINDSNNIMKQEYQQTIDEGYEPLEPYRNNLGDSQKSLVDVFNKSHNKSNCPLPEVPHEKEQNTYKYLFKEVSLHDEDCLSNHSYEYCAGKINDEQFYNNDSDDGYEYCKCPKENLTIKRDESSNKEISPVVVRRSMEGYSSLKSRSPTSSMGYEKISSVYESIPPKMLLELQCTKHCNSDESNYNEHGINYDECNCEENIYDTIKPCDTISESNCYESIPGSPHSVIKMRQKLNTNKYQAQLLPKHNIPFDAISNFSQSYSGSTISSENKTNSIYGQRSIVSSVRSETTIYGNAPSEISSSDRSDDWVDMSDQEESAADHNKNIKRERSRGKRSPASWSRKVRHQWTKKPSKKGGSDDVDSSDSEHLYEPFPHQGPAEDSRLASEYYDSFDSDSESEHNSIGREPFHHVHKGDIDNTQLPEPPSSSNIYTLTRFASAAGKKMRELKRNFTKSTRKKSTSDIEVKTAISIEEKDPSKIKQVNEQKSKKLKENIKTIPDYASQNIVSSALLKRDEANVEKFQKTFKKQHSSPCEGLLSEFPVRNALSNINLNNPSQINSELVNSSPKSEQKYANVSNNNVEIQEAQNNTSKMEKDSGTLSRKSYLSFKSKFKRNSTFTEGNKSRSQSLSVMNSTFYLNDLLNDSNEDKSNESLANEIYKEESQPIPPTRKHNRKSTPERILTDSTQLNEPDIPTVAINVKKMSPVSGNKSYSSIKSPAARPNAPPPPPPDTGSPTSGDPKRLSASKKDKRALNSTSWYAECGLFKANEQYKPESNGNTKERTSSTSWYAEVGLYQIGNVSTSSGASSTLSGGGTCSTTTTAPSPPDTPVPPLGMFNQEPLYQFYDAAKLESVCREIGNYSDSDGYEEIANFKEGVQNGKPVQRPSAMTLVSPQKGPSRTLWCEIPEVINSAILNTLSPTQKKLQEAMFEIISSEASYLNSLTVLESIFMSHPAFEDERIVSNDDKNILFGNIPPVKRCSEQLLADLEQCWQENILLRGLCQIVRNHAEKNFHVYVKYCESQVFLVKTLKKLKTDPKFNDILNQIESQPACQCLCLHSFLMLPMQRATRLPLLMDAVLKKLTASDDEYQPCLDALATLNNIVSQCNEGARNVERIEEIRILSSQIEFPPHIKEIPIITLKTDKKNSAAESQRWLVRSGELTQLLWRGDDQSKLTFGRKVTKITLHLFLFTDLLVVTKKRSDESYMVVDYCKRSLLEITSSDMLGPSPIKESAGKYTLLLTMLENYENKTVEMLLSCVSESDRQRWMEACLPPPSNNPDETVYEGWDCPQVAAVFCYQSTQPDELNLQKGDIVNVNKKMADGWHHGERIRDGEKGWFPGTYTVEIASPHVRARNLRQRYRLLALTGNYLGQNKKK